MGPLNMPNMDVCLESIPKFNYDAFNIMIPQGGICIRGSYLFSSYYKREDLIKEVLVDGWVYVGN
jgi:long-chain acyl-CoA synthetase